MNDDVKLRPKRRHFKDARIRAYFRSPGGQAKPRGLMLLF